MGIYTRTGDDGSTALFGGVRVPKHDPRVAAYGTLDELNAILGMVLAQADDELRGALAFHQAELFAYGSRLAAQDAGVKGLPTLNPGLIETMEAGMDKIDAELAPLRNFILPGGCPQAALLHLARTVCRRAEREVSAVRISHPKSARQCVTAIKYLNRLSDYLFVLARLANHRAGNADVVWAPDTDRS